MWTGIILKHDLLERIFLCIIPIMVISIFPNYGNFDSTFAQSIMLELDDFNKPGGVAVDNLGNIYVADTNNDRVQKFNIGSITISLSETIGVGDTINTTFDRPKLVSLSESIGTGDILNTSSGRPKLLHLSESVGTADTVNTSFGRPKLLHLSESVGIGERLSITTPSGSTITFLSVPESICVSDTVNRTSGRPKLVSLSESVGTADTVNTSSGRPRIVSLSESIGISDTVNTASGRAELVSLSESVSVGERLSITTPSGSIITFLSVPESIGTADTVTSAGRAELVSLSESIGIGDILSVTTTTEPPSGNSNDGQSGSGKTGVGPSGGGGGGKTLTTGGRLPPSLVIYEISYDSCHGNITKIVVGTDKKILPSVKVRTSLTGVISAQLAKEQPFTKQNMITKIDRFVFTAPLAQNEKFFIVNVEDIGSISPKTVQRTVTISKCIETITYKEFDSSSDVMIKLVTSPKIFEGNILRPSAHVTNYAGHTITGTVSLMIDEKIVYSSVPIEFKPGISTAILEWPTPVLDKFAIYQIKARGEFNNITIETDSSKLYTLPNIKTFSTNQLEELKMIPDETGKPLAKVTVLFSSSENEEHFRYRVIAPDGTCVIGSSECLVNKSTTGLRGNLASIILEGQTYRVRYSGPQSDPEWFSITSIKPILGKWVIDKESEENIMQQAHAMKDSFIKVKYRFL